MENNIMYNVKNRSAASLVYRIPEENIRREFMPGETRKIAKSELEKLSWQPGGREILARYLQITNAEAIKELNIHTEPEYYMSEEQIVDLIKNGSLDAFLDCLDFAPTGVIDLLKSFSVNIPLLDLEKRQALKNKTGFDVDAALRHVMEEKLDDEDNSSVGEAPAQRRVQPTNTAGRRTEGSKYKVVSKEDPTE